MLDIYNVSIGGVWRLSLSVPRCLEPIFQQLVWPPTVCGTSNVHCHVIAEGLFDPIVVFSTGVDLVGKGTLRPVSIDALPHSLSS